MVSGRDHVEKVDNILGLIKKRTADVHASGDLSKLEKQVLVERLNRYGAEIKQAVAGKN